MSQVSESRAFNKSFFRVMLGVAAGALSMAMVSSGALAQTWPNKPITIVSPYPAGGITDALCRIVGDKLGKALGQPVIVEDRPGAGGAIAAAGVAQAAPDGYTLLMGGSAVSTILPALNPNVAYDPVKDFEPVAYVAALPLVLVANPSVPAANLKEFISYAKANGGKLSCAHNGVGTGTHLACVKFGRSLGIPINAIAYKGAPQVNVDLLANRVQFYFGTLSTEIGYVRAGQLRAYGVASAERVASAPAIPTLAEQGLPGFNMDAWNALYAPAKTPRPIVGRLNAEVVKILQMPEVRKKIEATGSILHVGSAEQLRKLTVDEYRQYRELGAEAHIQLK